MSLLFFPRKSYRHPALRESCRMVRPTATGDTCWQNYTKKLTPFPLLPKIFKGKRLFNRFLEYLAKSPKKFSKYPSHPSFPCNRFTVNAFCGDGLL